MNLLAFDTSTDVLSIAVTRGAVTRGEATRGVVAMSGAQTQVWQHTGAGGAQASAALIPAILQLLAQANLKLNQLDAIAFGRGPGSFTGLRTACSVAQGLALGAGVPVLPIDTLLAVAEDARHQLGGPAHLGVVAVLDARMDQVYGARYVLDGGVWAQQGDFCLCPPEDLLKDLADWQDGPGAHGLGRAASPTDPKTWVIAGNAASVYGARLPNLPNLPGSPSLGHAGAAQTQLVALPSAVAMLRLAPQLLSQGLALRADQALPLYIRDKVAQTTHERELIRSRELAQSAPSAL